MDKCRHAKTYKGSRAPKCGCTTCKVIWIEAELDRTTDYIERLLSLINEAVGVLYRPIRYKK